MPRKSLPNNQKLMRNGKGNKSSGNGFKNPKLAKIAKLLKSVATEKS